MEEEKEDGEERLSTEYTGRSGVLVLIRSRLSVQVSGVG